jgi:hypothetical protein
MTQIAKLIPLVQKEYHRADGRFAPVHNAHLVPDAVVTANGIGNVLEMGEHTTLRLKQEVLEGSGTLPTLDCVIETSSVSDPDSALWYTVGIFSQKIAGGVSEDQVFPGCDRFVRARWTVGGTGTPTFRHKVTGEVAG